MSEKEVSLIDMLRENMWAILAGAGGVLAGLHFANIVPFEEQWAYARNFGEDVWDGLQVAFRGIDEEAWNATSNVPDKVDRIDAAYNLTESGHGADAAVEGLKGANEVAAKHGLNPYVIQSSP